MPKRKKPSGDWENPKFMAEQKANDALGAASRKRDKLAHGTAARLKAEADVAAAHRRHRDALAALWGR